jgi:hypothetical protein
MYPSCRQVWVCLSQHPVYRRVSLRAPQEYKRGQRVAALFPSWVQTLSPRFLSFGKAT